MAAGERWLTSWSSATLDILLSVLGFVIIWYPLVSLGNAMLGSLVGSATVTLIVGVLALGGAYPVVAGDWSLGQVGEYVFMLTAAALGWGILGMLLILGSGVTLSGSNPAPQAVVWAAAYLTAYLFVYQSQLSVLR